MKSKGSISRSVITRMPRYYRFLKRLSVEGLDRISSAELASRMGLTASQVRQDFNYFGDFGQQGYGYNVTQLRDEIGKILGIDKQHTLILVGAGNLGKAIFRHIKFNELGFTLIGVFDSNPDIAVSDTGGIEILDSALLPGFCEREHPDAAIITVPESAAPEVVAALWQAGVKNYWNFSHYDIDADFPNATVENVHLNDSLMTLCYNITDNI